MFILLSATANEPNKLLSPFVFNSKGEAESYASENLSLFDWKTYQLVSYTY